MENQRLLEDLQTMTMEKQQHDEFVALQQHSTRDEGVMKEPNISLPAKFYGTRSLFRGFLDQVRLSFKCIPHDIQRMHLK